MSQERFRPGASGVFKVIVDSARKIKRAVTGEEEEVAPEVHDLGTSIAQAFIAGRIVDVHAAGTSSFQQRTARDSFVASWRDAIQDRGPLTGFEISNAGAIEMAFIPGLEDVPQSAFVAFLQIAFSTPTVPLDDSGAFTIGIVLLHEDGKVRVGALHAR